MAAPSRIIHKQNWSRKMLCWCYNLTEKSLTKISFNMHSSAGLAINKFRVTLSDWINLVFQLKRMKKVGCPNRTEPRPNPNKNSEKPKPQTTIFSQNHGLRFFARNSAQKWSKLVNLEKFIPECLLPKVLIFFEILSLLAWIWWNW